MFDIFSNFWGKWSIMCLTGSGTSSTLVVPVFFSLLGLVIIFVGTAYIVRIRRKSNVEVADFDFHPEIDSQGSQGSQILSRIRGTLSDLFQRNEYIRRHRLAKYHRTSAKMYGSIEGSDDELWWKTLYLSEVIHSNKCWDERLDDAVLCQLILSNNIHKIH